MNGISITGAGPSKVKDNILQRDRAAKWRKPSNVALPNRDMNLGRYLCNVLNVYQPISAKMG